jgi:transcriptional regulator with XRE-family HTH domain
MNEETARIYTQSSLPAFSRRIRALRRARGWTLLDVERQSMGAITAVSMGAYERGTRSLSLAKSIEIATLFGQPLSAILDQSAMGGDKVKTPASISHPNQHLRLIIDLRALYKSSGPELEPSLEFLRRYVKEIAHRRNDWNGEVISLRESDLSTLSIALAIKSDDLYRWLTLNSFLLISHRKI